MGGSFCTVVTDVSLLITTSPATWIRFGSVWNGPLVRLDGSSSSRTCENGATVWFVRNPGPEFCVTRAVPTAVLFTVDWRLTSPPAVIEALLWTVVVAVGDDQLKPKAPPKPAWVSAEKMASPVASASAADAIVVAPVLVMLAVELRVTSALGLLN